MGREPQTGSSELTREEYNGLISEMADEIIELMRESDAETREEWDEEWIDLVWTDVENSDLLRGEADYDKILEYSAANLKVMDYEHLDNTKEQMVRESIEEDVIRAMRRHPKSPTPPPYRDSDN